MTRMSIDVSEELHQMIKLQAMFDRKTIRDFVISAIEKVIKKRGAVNDCDREVNAETAKVLEECESGIGLTHYNNIDDLFRKFGC